jgi:hypothetical protein
VNSPEPSTEKDDAMTLFAALTSDASLLLFLLGLGILIKWTVQGAASGVAKSSGKGIVENILGGIFKKR